MRHYATLGLLIVLGAGVRFGGDAGGGPGRQGQDLPNGTAMPLGEFQEDLRLRQSVPLTISLPKCTERFIAKTEG